MGFRRVTTAETISRGHELTRAMVGIGMAFAETGLEDPNIEDTLVGASIEGMETPDFRVLAVLVSWIETHVSYINADRLIRAVFSVKKPRVLAFWASIGQWLSKDRRFFALRKNGHEGRVDLLPTGTDFQISRRGEDIRFAETNLRVPAGVLERRKGDVFTPQELAKHHTAYRYRVLMGPSYRADMWAVLSKRPDLTAAELARTTYGSFATAWTVRRDYGILNEKMPAL